MLTLLVRSVILYLIVILALRLMGKKQLGELQPSELVTTILISNIATVSIEDLSLPMLAGIIPILLIVSLDVIVSVVTLKSDKVRKIITGSPQVVISNGNIDQAQMHELRYTLDDILEAMRDGGIFDLSQVQFAIVETTGKINFFQRPEAPQPAEDPPVEIVKDGILDRKKLDKSGLDEKWLRKILFDNNVTLKNVFFLAAKSGSDYHLLKKEGKNKK